MRKVWLTMLSVVMMGLLAVPTYAAGNNCNENNYNWLWQWFKRPAVTKPAVPTLPGKSEPAAPPVTGEPGKNTPVQSLTADENHIFQAVNAERAKAGLAPLKVDTRLVETARAKSQDMIDNGYFDHQSPVLGNPFDQMYKAGISYRSAGENIAGNSTAAKAMESWMNSPGHRANILNPDFTHIGIGVVDGGPYGKMLTQQFIGI